jgi:AraC-like DNA-binding protein
VLSGNTIHNLNGETDELPTGSLCIIRPNDFHCCLGTSDPTNAMHRNILVERTEFERMCNLLSPTIYKTILAQSSIKLQLSTSQIKQLEDTLAQVSSMHPSNTDYRDTLYRFALLHVLKRFFLNIKEHSPDYNVPSFITSILTEIDRPMGLHLTSKTILNSYPYNPSYICRAFKQYTGTTISQYLNNKRLEYAELLIKTTNLPLMQIAETVGYQNYSYFHRKFFEHFHQTPQEIKIKAQKENNS